MRDKAGTVRAVLAGDDMKDEGGVRLTMYGGGGKMLELGGSDAEHSALEFFGKDRNGRRIRLGMEEVPGLVFFTAYGDFGRRFDADNPDPGNRRP